MLKAIEAQHSLFVERAKDIYSFSHLTFQEYFTAIYLEQNQSRGALTRLIEQHLGERRWREVFLLTASLLNQQSADAFFAQLQRAIDHLVAADPSLLALVTWADAKAKIAMPPGEGRYAAFRLAYLSLDRARTRARFCSQTRYRS